MSLGLTYSPIKGPEGNIEYLLYIEKNILAEIEFENRTNGWGSMEDIENMESRVRSIVEEAHAQL